MSKWKQPEIQPPEDYGKPVFTEGKKIKRERIEEWTIKIAQALVINGKTSLSAIPNQAYSLAKDIATYLDSSEASESSLSVEK